MLEKLVGQLAGWFPLVVLLLSQLNWAIESVDDEFPQLL